MHNANICHRDLKPENILLDDNYNPKIEEFYYSCMNANNLQENSGTLRYKAPEILMNQPYNGIKADIFSLGQLLFNLVTGLNGFKSARQDDQLYRLIMEHNYDQYWNQFANINLSQNFKDLFVRMVSFNPEQRPTIDQILNHPWMQEINNLNNEQMNILENEVRQEFHNREFQVLQNNKREIINDDDDLNNGR